MSPPGAETPSPATPPEAAPNAPAAPDSRAWLLGGVTALIVVVLALYANTLSVPFHYDDTLIIDGDPFQDGEVDAREIFDWTPRRFLPNVTLAWTWSAIGETDLDEPTDATVFWPYHLFNILIHAANAVLVLLLLRRAPTLAARPAVPVIAALIFAAHPLQTQAVTYIVQRAESMAAMGLLLATLAHAVARERLAAGETGRAVAAWAAAAAATVGAGLSKETAAALPVLIFTWELAFGLGARAEVAPLRRLRAAGLAALPYFAVSGMIALMATRYLGGGSNDFAAWPGLSYPFTQLKVHWRYLALVVFPFGQTIDHDHIPFATAGPDAGSILGGAGLIGLVVLAVRVAPRAPAATFGILWHLGCLSVTSSVLPIRDAMVEHRLYLALAGDALLMAWALDAIVRRAASPGPPPGPRPILVAGAILIVALGGLTIARNDRWRSWESLWGSAAKRAPDRSRPWQNLGVARMRAGKRLRPDDAAGALELFEQALDAYATAVDARRRRDERDLVGRSHESYPLLLYNAALAATEKASVLRDLGRATEALTALERAEGFLAEVVAIAPKLRQSYSALGNARYDRALLLGDAAPDALFESAIAAYDDALARRDPKATSVRFNRAQMRVLLLVRREQAGIDAEARHALLAAAYDDFAAVALAEPDRTTVHRQAGEVAFQLAIAAAKLRREDEVRERVDAADRHLDAFEARAPEERASLAPLRKQLGRLAGRLGIDLGADEQR